MPRQGPPNGSPALTMWAAFQSLAGSLGICGMFFTGSRPYTHERRLGAEFGGGAERNSRTKFSNELILGKHFISISTPKISNDLILGKHFISISTPKISNDLFCHRPCFVCLLPVSIV